jgi:hypothetical protein
VRHLLFGLVLAVGLLGLGARGLLGHTGSSVSTVPAVVATVRPTIAEEWVPAPNGLRTRCADEPGVRLYLAEGDHEPVGLLDETCNPARRP